MKTQPYYTSKYSILKTEPFATVKIAEENSGLDLSGVYASVKNSPFYRAAAVPNTTVASFGVSSYFTVSLRHDVVKDIMREVIKAGANGDQVVQLTKEKVQGMMFHFRLNPDISGEYELWDFKRGVETHEDEQVSDIELSTIYEELVEEMQR